MKAQYGIWQWWCFKKYFPDHQEYLVEEFFLFKSDSFNITHSVNGENIGHQKIGYQEKKRPP